MRARSRYDDFNKNSRLNAYKYKEEKEEVDKFQSLLIVNSHFCTLLASTLFRSLTTVCILGRCLRGESKKNLLKNTTVS